MERVKSSASEQQHALPCTLRKQDCTYTKCYCEENVYWLACRLAGLPEPLADAEQAPACDVLPTAQGTTSEPGNPATSRAAATSELPGHSLKVVREVHSAAAAVDISQLWAIFITNPVKQVPLWRQSAGDPARQGLVVWDYHVILIQHHPASGQSIASAPAALGSGSGGALVWDLDTTLPFPCSLKQYAAKALMHGALDLAARFQRRFRVVPAAEYLAHFASDRSHMRQGDRWLSPPPWYPGITATDGCTNNIQRYWDTRLPGDRPPHDAESGSESDDSPDSDGGGDTVARDGMIDSGCSNAAAVDAGRGDCGGDVGGEVRPEERAAAGEVLFERAFLERFGCA